MAVRAARMASIIHLVSYEQSDSCVCTPAIKVGLVFDKDILCLPSCWDIQCATV